MALAALRKAQTGLAIPFSPKTTFRKKIGWHIAQGTVHAAMFDISDSDAAELLERNEGENYRNRAQSESTVLKYASEMERGWRLTGEPIILSQSGHLLNGQHRLQACVTAGVSFPTLVVFGIRDDAFAFLDQGRKRSAADIFSIHGVLDYTRMASATLWVWKYHHTGMRNPGGLAGNAPRTPSPDQLYDYYLTLKGLDDSRLVTDWFTKVKLVAPSMMGALHYLCAGYDRPAADRFFASIATGENLKKTDPALKVRNRFIEERVAGGRLSDIYSAAFTVQAWNAMRTGRKITHLRWRTEAAPDLAFPTII